MKIFFLFIINNSFSFQENFLSDNSLNLKNLNSVSFNFKKIKRMFFKSFFFFLFFFCLLFFNEFKMNRRKIPENQIKYCFKFFQEDDEEIKIKFYAYYNDSESVDNFYLKQLSNNFFENIPKKYLYKYILYNEKDVKIKSTEIKENNSLNKDDNFDFNKFYKISLDFVFQEDFLLKNLKISNNKNIFYIFILFLIDEIKKIEQSDLILEKNTNLFKKLNLIKKSQMRMNTSEDFEIFSKIFK